MVHLFHGLEVDNLSDIDHELLSSGKLDKISSVYFFDYPSVSDHKPLVVYCSKATTDESFLLPKKIYYMKKVQNVLNLRKKFVITINLSFLVKN